VEKLAKKDILPGLSLKRFGEENVLLIAVTEKKTKAEMDALIEALREVTNG
jgi:glycine cleavage system pyridoxal-binding protein P